MTKAEKLTAEELVSIRLRQERQTHRLVLYDRRVLLSHIEAVEAKSQQRKEALELACRIIKKWATNYLLYDDPEQEIEFAKLALED